VRLTVRCMAPNKSLERTREGQSAKLIHRRARRSAQSLDRMETSSPTSLGSQWQKAASELGIACQSPYTLVMSNGERFEFEVLLPQFGATRGMLLGTEFNAAAAQAATLEGFGFSYLDAGSVDEPFKLSEYIECLTDWGWVAKGDPPPTWYGSRGRDAV